MNSLPDQVNSPLDLSSCDHFHEILWTPDDFVEDGPIAALELQLTICAEADRTTLPRQIAELLRSLSDREIELGGNGMILDRDASLIDASGLTLVLRSLDARYSKTRLEKLAEEISTAEAEAAPSKQLSGVEGLLNETLTEMETWNGTGRSEETQSAFASVTAKCRQRQKVTTEARSHPDIQVGAVWTGGTGFAG